MYKNIVSLVEDASEKYGYRTFSVDTEGRISFRRLRNDALLYGRQIRTLVGDGRTGYPVAIFGEKSNVLLTMMFGAVYAGAFYVVLNPEQPTERLDNILKVLEPELLVYADDLQARAEELEYQGKKLAYSELEKQADDQVADVSDVKDFIANIPGASPLYGIFTSGSTGTPKCVLISHENVLDFIGHFAEIFHFTERDVIGNQAPFDFDVSVKDIYTALYTGASLVLIPREYFSTPARLLDYICDHGVTSLTWAVSALCIISGLKGFSYRVPTRIRRVMFSGEVMPLKQLRIWQENLPDASYVNLYGPTEITCNCMYAKLPVPYTSDRQLPLGRPFPGRQVFLEDEAGLVPVHAGSHGEICVAGESIGIGYYHNPSQTEAHFKMEMHDGRIVRVYHTGDLAEIGEDGSWYFNGRSDFQIKHMGHRIELEEIEGAVESEPDIARCICTFDAEKERITAFYTGNVPRRELHMRLKKKLPLYMIPNRFIHVTGFILNKNGKIDRHMLGHLKTAEG